METLARNKETNDLSPPLSKPNFANANAEYIFNNILNSSLGVVAAEGTVRVAA